LEKEACLRDAFSFSMERSGKWLLFPQLSYFGPARLWELFYSACNEKDLEQVKEDI
jgi:hypothetical protein